MTQQAAAVRVPTEAQAGLVDTDQSELSRAERATAQATRSVLAEERLARTDGSAEQQRRVEDAQRDLVAAEAFEEALDDGRL